MRFLTASGLLVAGMIAAGAARCDHDKRYDNDRIFKRQGALIDKHYRRMPKAKDARYEQLTKSISFHENASRILGLLNCIRKVLIARAPLTS